MEHWDPQQYEKIGKIRDVGQDVIEAAKATAEHTLQTNPNIQPIFSLGHLSHLTGVEYKFLRRIVSRTSEDPYRTFRIRKKVVEGKQTFRTIAVPDPRLMAVQRWINRNILSKARPHFASFAYESGKSIKQAAQLHCGASWLIKVDVQNFFESISEIQVYRVFQSLGYQPLISLEMARICTRLGTETRRKRRSRWISFGEGSRGVTSYSKRRMGHLPQGAPSSPMLANLAVMELDKNVLEIARSHDLVYTRYADDFVLSKSNLNFGRDSASKVIAMLYRQISNFGLSPNTSKTRIVTPGGRKIVLGLLVDGEEPRLTRAFRANLRQHLHYLGHEDFGPVEHAKNRNFVSIIGLRNHVLGLIAHASSIDPEYATMCREKLEQIDWPI